VGRAAAFHDLRSYLAALDRRGELKTIIVPVDPRLEIAEIHRRVIAEEGPALLFTNPGGSGFPVVTNLFGTKARAELAFGDDGEKLIRGIASLPHELLPPTWGKLWQKRALFSRLLRTGLKRVSSAPVLEITESPPRLDTLPLLTTWPQDGGPFVTLPLVYTEHPETKIPNLGMYRLQRFDSATTGLHMQIGKGGGFHLACAAELRKQLPVNVFLGGPPLAILAAVAPLPENVPELLLASLLLGSRLRLADDPKGGLPLLADAEFVLVGSSDPAERKPEGPFGDHYGYYSLEHGFPVFRCSRVYRKAKPICPATVVGKPRQEDFFIGDYLQQLLSPLFPLVMPAVRDLWSYGETGYHSLAAAVTRERYKREAMATAFRILGEGQLSLTKFLLLIDQPLNLKNFRSVFEHLLERCDFRTDLYVFSNLSMDTLDYTGPKLNEGSKGVMLGIGDPIRELPALSHGPLPAGITSQKVFCRGCLVVSGPAYHEDPSFPSRLATAPEIFSWPLVILADDAEKCAQSTPSFLWTVFTRFEPAADIHARAAKLHRFHPSLESPVVIDCRMKPPYPEELFCDEETRKLVDCRWGEYFGEK
jgi:UbiD family decarboxylase